MQLFLARVAKSSRKTKTSKALVHGTFTRQQEYHPELVLTLILEPKTIEVNDGGQIHQTNTVQSPARLASQPLTSLRTGRWTVLGRFRMADD